MRMTTLAVLALVVGAVLAGCSQKTTTTGTTDSFTSPAYVTPTAPKMDAVDLLADLKTFAAAYPERHDNVPTHEGARQWIMQQYASYGLEVHRQNFTAGGLPQANIVGIHWGQVRDQVVVVGGHYDTTHWDCAVDSAFPGPAACAGHKLSQGAYDDGSGTMMSVHLGKTWANVSSYYSIAFVTYDGEERGLEGANAFVSAATDGTLGFANFTIHGALDIDMFGITWPGTNAPTQILDNSDALHKVFQDTRKAMGMPDNMVYCQDMAALGSSDFQAYFDQKIPVVFFSSDFGKYTPPGSPASPPQDFYPNWHFIDTYDTMQQEAGGATQLQQGFQTASDLASAELHALADMPQLTLDVHDPPAPTGAGNQPC